MPFRTSYTRVGMTSYSGEIWRCLLFGSGRTSSTLFSTLFLWFLTRSRSSYAARASFLRCYFLSSCACLSSLPPPLWFIAFILRLPVIPAWSPR